MYVFASDKEIAVPYILRDTSAHRLLTSSLQGGGGVEQRWKGGCN